MKTFLNAGERNIYLLLVVIAALSFIPFLGSVHLFDWDECNFAECAREMIVSGNYFRVTVGFEPFWEKPPLFFWLQALSMHVFGINEFAARFVNAVVGAFTLCIVYAIGSFLFSRQLGFFWALSFLGSFLPRFFFTSGIIDPLFNLLIFLSIFFVSKSSGRSSSYALAGVFCGLATLTKGPVAILLVVICLCIFWIFRRHCAYSLFIRHTFIFVLSVLAVSFIFYGTETILHGTWFFREFIKYHLRLFSTADAGHGRPFYFHFVVTLFGCFPASLFALLAFTNRSNELSQTQRDFKTWMVILLAVVLILFSIVKTKTVLYSSLTYFPITFFSAYSIDNIINKKQSVSRAFRAILLVWGLTVSLIISSLPILLINKHVIMPYIKDRFAVECLKNPVVWSFWDAMVGAGYATAFIVVGWLLCKGYLKVAFIVLLVCGSLCVQAFTIVFAPRIERYTQGSVVDFYKSLSQQDCYIEPLFKTYAHYFYGRIKPCSKPNCRDRQWLLSGDIDKPVYFVCKWNRKDYFMQHYQLKELKTEYGFSYLLREAVQTKE